MMATLPSRAELAELIGRPVRVTKVRTKGPEADYPTVVGRLVALAGHVDDGTPFVIVERHDGATVAIPVSRIAAIGAQA